MSNAVERARSLPPPRTGQMVTIPKVNGVPDIPTLHEYMKQYGLRVRGWRGDVLVLEPMPESVPDQSEKEGEEE